MLEFLSLSLVKFELLICALTLSCFTTLSQHDRSRECILVHRLNNHVLLSILKDFYCLSYCLLDGRDSFNIVERSSLSYKDFDIVQLVSCCFWN